MDQLNYNGLCQGRTRKGEKCKYRATRHASFYQDSPYRCSIHSRDVHTTPLDADFHPNREKSIVEELQALTVSSLPPASLGTVSFHERSVAVKPPVTPGFLNILITGKKGNRITLTGGIDYRLLHPTRFCEKIDYFEIIWNFYSSSEDRNVFEVFWYDKSKPIPSITREKYAESDLKVLKNPRILHHPQIRKLMIEAKVRGENLFEPIDLSPWIPNTIPCFTWKSNPIVYLQLREIYCTLYQQFVTQHHFDIIEELKIKLSKGVNLRFCGINTDPHYDGAESLPDGDFPHAINTAYLNPEFNFDFYHVIAAMVVLEPNEYPWIMHRTMDL